MRKLERYRPVAALLLVLHLGACTTWRPVTVNPQQFIEEEQPDRIRVWQNERATVLRDPVMDRDTQSLLGGVRPDGLFTTEPAEIALTDITLIEARRPSNGRTITLAVGVAVVFSFVVVTLISLQGWQMGGRR